MKTWALTLALVLGASDALPARAADFSARDLSKLLYAAAPRSMPDLSAKDLSGLDLAGLDFKQARLAKTNLFGADLSRADLSSTDLTGAVLDRTSIIGAKFDDANLEGASVLRPNAFSDFSAPASEAPSFRGANLKKSRIFARLSRADFSGADLSDAYCAPFGKTGFIEVIWRTELTSANLSHANMERADFTHALFNFANLRNARLARAILVNADLSGADLTGADLTGADLTGADLDSTILIGVRGLDTAIGMDTTKNAGKARR